MQLGMIGLGRMGANMVRRVRKAGHECVAYDVHADAVSALAREGVTGATALPALSFGYSGLDTHRDVDGHANGYEYAHKYEHTHHYQHAHHHASSFVQ